MWDLLPDLLPRRENLLSDYIIEVSMEEDHTSAFRRVDDYVCAICDDGGQLLSCDGICGRWFHATKRTGAYSKCTSLKLSIEQQEVPKFLCNNCKYKHHQCFVCGQLGPSDMSSKNNSNQQGVLPVFQCNKDGCKRFYHPECLSQWDLNEKVEEVLCPLHECMSCKNEQKEVSRKHATEGGDMSKMQLVICRRCPKAFHPECMPRTAPTWNTEGGILMYCSDHKIAKRLRSAKRDHLKFPEIEVESAVEGQIDHVQKGRDNGPQTHTGKPAPEQAETSQHRSIEHNASTGSGPMEAFAAEPLFPGPHPSILP
ncbi:protein ENHANCED DOWNY MILDEW 2 isoform X1 [Brachypodium distachyon]|uniref:Zinc finger PHD-type domain-containing protein n=2 Tax=Brachypodium distachyon TaxID=15368 RepID=A0A0Q3LH52_BRADI|nr:protein ENHANCED DOWNY MILDEW 2 isoform X1 [Brachypodium distachyon]KQK22416.1 hypothetical protein BRADI_1g67067v3 [Brachypodium distachyon]|eukprot:XP_024313147.1 protein ENHANCED DOWNY MILDEW 2 isoform X1 [Brachypodium distachyon]